MMIEPARIFSLGDNAVTVEFGNEISEALNDAAINLSRHFNAHPFPGFVEAVPAMASTTIFYRPHEVHFHDDLFPTAFASVEAKIKDAILNVSASEEAASQLIEIPISFASNHALDLEKIAGHSGITPDETIEIFLAKVYRVYMLGFLPGFAYMGEVDGRIAVPRLTTPRTAVPKGSVGIAGRQTGIYPSESPGGWQIIGCTELELLTDNTNEPCIFRPGDHVRFFRPG
ncbi:MAG: 5-oxoprolinase subunit PxpB [Acidobacteria bacterium]|nr:5-oxoprolinase subunit PxpB [Acidobacteriota bacterium]